MNKKVKNFTWIILLSLLSAAIVLVLEYHRLSDEFFDDALDVNRLFLQKMTSLETVLISLAGLYHSSDNLNQAELSSFSEEMLKAYPFIDHVIVAEKVALKDVAIFESSMHKQGYSGMRLQRENNTKQQQNQFYLPVNFVEPMTPMSSKILGWDLYSLSGLNSEINYSIQTGKVSASNIALYFSSTRPSLLMFKALYLGRYPPQTKSQRLAMLDGLVAIDIQVDHFLRFLELKDYQLTASLYNSPTSDKHAETKNMLRYIDGNMRFVYIEKFNIYGKEYQLKLMRSISVAMFDVNNLVLWWLLSMLVFLSIKMGLQRHKESEDEIKYLAYYDSLTALPNRTSFKEKLAIAIEKSVKVGESGAVLFMDVDEFKRINDTLGHNIGDELLQQISKRLIKQMRQSDSIGLEHYDMHNNMVTRLGGDEFTVLLTDINNINAVGLVANRILQSISKPFQLSGHEVYVTSSIGIAVFPHDGSDVDQLLKHADTAMYHAKQMGKDNFQFYSEKMSEKIEKRLQLEVKLHQALEKKEFRLYYQPQVDMVSKKIVAAEALIRWQQSELGFIYPDEFIPLAEETGQIIRIGEWVINEACRQNKAWQGAGYEPICISVNLSCLQFMQDDLCSKVANALSKTNLSAEYLELEITEGIMMNNVEQSIATIKQLNKSGVGVSVDDFGTGYSSLSYLKKFPLKSLKVDRSFVMDIPDDKDDMMITSTIISMAKNLNLKVIAEGVESQQQVDFLSEHQCDLMQGYYFSRPIPAEEFETLLKQQCV